MKKFFKGLSTAIFGMHLWLPIVYSLIFLMITAISGTIGGSWPYYFLGLSLAFAGSLLLVFFLKGKSSRKDKKAASTAEVALISKSGDKEPEQHKSEYVLDDSAPRSDVSDYIAAEQSRYAGSMTAQPGMNANYSAPKPDVGDMRGYYSTPEPAQPVQFNHNYMNPQPLNGGAPNAEYVRPTYDPQTAHDALYSSFSSSPASASPSSSAAFSPYVQPQNAPSAQNGTSPRISDYEARQERETPTIFRMRANPNILVYEYSDRLEKYEILPNGDRRRLSVEYK